MKALGSLLIAKSLAIVAMGAAALAAPTVTHATERDGVACSTDTEAVYSGGVLKCRLPVVTDLPSLCPPGTTLNPSGSDTCVLRIGPTTTTTPSSPGIGVTGATRVPNPTQADVFRITNDVYFFPAGAFYIGNSANGVKCPAGYSAASTQSGRGLRCEDTIVKKAVCDIGWSIERRDGRARCFLGPVMGEYTIPENAGYIGLMGNPATRGWTLDTDRSGHGNTDYWIRDAKDYHYPESI